LGRKGPFHVASRGVQCPDGVDVGHAQGWVGKTKTTSSSVHPRKNTTGVRGGGARPTSGKREKERFHAGVCDPNQGFVKNRQMRDKEKAMHFGHSRRRRAETGRKGQKRAKWAMGELLEWGKTRTGKKERQL